MKENSNLYEQILDNMYEGIYFVDVNRKITFWNKGAERITGYLSEELVGKHCYDNILNHVDDRGTELCKKGCPLHKTIVDGNVREAGVYLHHKKGHRVSVSIRSIPIYDQGKIAGAVEVFVDDSQKAQLFKEIDKLKTVALYDPLTELPNRRYINTFIENRIRELSELGISFGVLMMDIDFFKLVNDQYGHDVGDEVLKMIAKTFQSVFRKSDLVGRWGGEEFLAIVTGVNQEELQSIAEKARMLVASSQLQKNKEVLKVQISVGATMARVNETETEMTKRADEALYISKETGRNKVTIL